MGQPLVLNAGANQYTHPAYRTKKCFIAAAAAGNITTTVNKGNEQWTGCKVVKNVYKVCECNVVRKTHKVMFTYLHWWHHKNSDYADLLIEYLMIAKTVCPRSSARVLNNVFSLRQPQQFGQLWHSAFWPFLNCFYCECLLLKRPKHNLLFVCQRPMLIINNRKLQELTRHCRLFTIINTSIKLARHCN